MLCQRHHRRLEATVLKSDVAVRVTLTIMRTFTKIREFALTYGDIIKRLAEIEKTIKIDQQQMTTTQKELMMLLHF